MKIIIKNFTLSISLIWSLIFGLISCNNKSKAELDFQRSVEEAANTIQEAVEDMEAPASDWGDEYQKIEDDYYDYYEEDSYKEEAGEVYYDVYGKPSNHISTCYTCGISYTVETLPYMDKYCSQGCCGAYEGLHPGCGY